MCVPVIPMLLGVMAVASVASALRPAPSFNMPAPPTVAKPPPAPTDQDINPNRVNHSAQAREQLRKQTAASQSWLSTKNTSPLGVAGKANTKNTMLGGVTTPLGA